MIKFKKIDYDKINPHRIYLVMYPGNPLPVCAVYCPKKENSNPLSSKWESARTVELNGINAAVEYFPIPEPTHYCEINFIIEGGK
jgi:hypothetical protein